MIRICLVCPSVFVLEFIFHHLKNLHIFIFLSNVTSNDSKLPETWRYAFLPILLLFSWLYFVVFIKCSSTKQFQGVYHICVTSLHNKYVLVMFVVFTVSSIFVCIQCVKFRKGFKDGDHGAYLAKAAFSQHLVEYQLVDGEAYPGNCSCGWGGAHAFARLAIVICYKYTFAHTD